MGKIKAPFKVNIDYEYQLFDPNYHENKYLELNQTFEFFFLLLSNEDESLIPVRKYSKNYLQKIKDIFDVTPTFVNESDEINNWWGKLENIQLEKSLNSKETSFYLVQKNRFGVTGGMIFNKDKDLSDLKNFFKERSGEDREWILKNPYSFSGKGQKKINTKRALSNENLKYIQSLLEKEIPVIIEPQVNIEIEYGAIFDGDEFYFHKNFTRSGGMYCGSEIIRPTKDMENYINGVVQYYKELGAKGTLSIDFCLTQNNHFHLFEVNYRKSMGLMLHLLSKKLGGGVGSTLKLSKSKPLKTDGLILSPEGGKMYVVYK